MRRPERWLLLAAVLGSGPLANALVVALRLPNHFRAIFAEGAFATQRGFNAWANEEVLKRKS